MRRVLGFVLLAFLAACGTLIPPTSTPTPAPVTETAAPPAPQTATPPASPSLRLWLPPQFDPNAETPAASLFKARLEAFIKAHPGLTLEIRIKGSETGPSLLETLSITRSAAPDVLPDLVALSRVDLEAAALKGLVHPLEGLTDLMAGPNWYPYARQLGQVQNTPYGLPFSGDVLAMVHRPNDFDLPPATWDDLFAERRSLAISSGDPNSYLQLSLYLSTGSPLLDEANHPILDEPTLVRVLQELDAGNLAAVGSEEAAWNAFVDGRADMTVTWVSHFILAPPPDSALMPLPGLEGTPFTLATGWVWALTGSNPQTDPLAVELAEWLVADDFLAEWNQAMGTLPPRPAALETLDSRGTLDAISQSAQILPSNDLILTVGPIFQETLGRMLNGGQAEVVAREAIEAMK
jgi:ABC-type glycerol-3-phosphate transport system substrate-binding protein